MATQGKNVLSEQQMIALGMKQPESVSDRMVAAIEEGMVAVAAPVQAAVLAVPRDVLIFLGGGVFSAILIFITLATTSR